MKICALLSLIYFKFFLLQPSRRKIERSAICRQNASSEYASHTLYLLEREASSFFDVNRWKFQRELKTTTFTPFMQVQQHHRIRFASIPIPHDMRVCCVFCVLCVLQSLATFSLALHAKVAAGALAPTSRQCSAHPRDMHPNAPFSEYHVAW